MNKVISVSQYNFIFIKFMIKQDDIGDFMLIICEGKALVRVDGNDVAEKGPNDVVGEAALQA
jgi:hypothetical protein